jgi:molecular chaperone DnaK (HSP70)
VLQGLCLTRLDANKFKTSDEAFGKRFEARQQLEAYVSRVEDMISDPGMAVKLKRGQKEKIEGALSEAMAQLEIEDTGAEDLRKKVIVTRIKQWSYANTAHRSLRSSALLPRLSPAVKPRAQNNQQSSS